MINFSTDSGEIISQIKHLQTDNEGFLFIKSLKQQNVYTINL